MSKMGFFLYDEPEKKIHLESPSKEEVQSRADDSMPIEWMNYDQDSFSDEDEDEDVYFDKENQRLYKFVDGTTFECEEL